MVRIFLYIAYTRSENQTDGWKLRNREKQKAMPPQTEGNDVKGIVDDGKCRLFFPHLISLIALGGEKKVFGNYKVNERWNICFSVDISFRDIYTTLLSFSFIHEYVSQFTEQQFLFCTF